MKIFLGASLIKEKIPSIFGQPLFRQMAKGAVVAFLVRVFGAVVTFLFNIVVARALGAEATGIFFLAFGVTSIATVAARLGLDQVVLRHVAVHASDNEWALVRAVNLTALRACILMSTALTIGVLMAAEYVAMGLMGKPDLVEPLRWMALAITPTALLNLQGQSLKGLKKIGLSMAIQGLLVPSLALLTLLPLAAFAGVTGVVWAHTAATIIVAFLAWLSWRIELARISVTEVRSVGFDALWRSSRHLFLISVINKGVIPWFPLFYLGVWASGDEVGVFATAARIAFMVSFVLTAVNNVVAPNFAELYAKGNLSVLGRAARLSALGITLATLPVFFTLIFFGDWIMSIFGDEFARGGCVLAILALGQMINTACGAVGVLLNMSGNEKTNLYITVISVLLLFILTIALVPAFGMYGTAAATSVAVISFNVLAVFQVRKKLQISPIFI
jgi:O-antigen/teichoic acid export membrane protein